MGNAFKSTNCLLVVYCLPPVYSWLCCRLGAVDLLTLLLLHKHRYVTPGAFIESAQSVGLAEDQLHNWELLAHVRFAVFKPGGPMAQELSKNPTVLVVNDTVFAHGGLLPRHGRWAPAVAAS